MQINQQTSVPQPDITTFQAMKNGIDITTVLPNATTLEYFYYIEAYKQVDMASFMCDYCKLHKGDEFGRDNPNISKFLSVLYAIADSDYNQDNCPNFNGYIKLAKEVFYENQ